MTEKIKKLIAKEFLILLTVIICVILSFVFAMCYNWFFGFKYNKIKTEILQKKKESDSLAAEFDIRITNGKDYISRIYYALSEEHLINNMNSSENNFRINILSDTVYQNNIYLLLKNNIDGFSRTLLEFKNLIKFSLTIVMIENKNKSNRLKKEIRELEVKQTGIMESFLSKSQIESIILNVLLVSVIILFPFRYIILSTKWSIKVLKKSV